MTFSKNNMLHKVFTMTIILFLIFSTLGIQPAKASTSVKLSPVEQLNVQKRSDGSVISVGDADIYYVSARKVAPITEDFAAMQFNTIDSTKSIVSAKLYFYILNNGDTVDGASNANLLVRVGSNSWTSSTSPTGFPTILAGAPSQNKNIPKMGTPVRYEIDVKQLLEHPSAVETQKLTLIMTSNSKNLNIVKHGNTQGSQYNPYLEITYAPLTVTHTVSFNVDGGSTVAPQSVTSGGKATLPTPPPTKAGYTFGGWYTSNAFTTTFDFNNVITADTTVYAKWTPITHTVNFNVDGGSAVTTQTVASGEKATAPTAPTKAGHTFGGWYTSNAFTTAFDFNSVITANTTIYAKWTPVAPVTHTVSFDVDGGSAVTSQSVTSGGKATIPTPPPTKAGYTFGGWYTSSAFTTTFDFNSVITTNTTIYAKWTAIPVTHTVSFDVDGGSAVTSQTVASGGKATAPTAPIKAGYTFVGWYTSNAFTTTFDFNSVITANTTIYAKWTPVAPVTHTVSFDVDGGSAVMSQTVASGGKATAPTTPTKAGYTFVGWYTSNAFTTTFDFNSVITANTIVYARWISNVVPPIPVTDEEAVANAKAALAIGYGTGDSATSVTQNLTLAVSGVEGTTITWTSSNPTVVATDGTVTRLSHTLGDQSVTLTATITKGKVTETKIFKVTVKASNQTDAEAVANAKAALAIGYSVGDSETNVTKNLQLPTTGSDGTAISWISSNLAVATANGGVLRPVVGDSTVVLTATIVKGNVSDTKTFTIIVKGQDISYPPVTSVPDEPPTSDSSSTPTSTVENINVDVAAGNGQIISQAFIRRTTNSDGTVRDVVTFTLQSATEAIAKLREQGTNIVRLILPDQRDRVNEILFSVPSDVVTILKNGGVNLEIVTNNVQILIPASSLESFTGDLYFRLVPIKAQAEKLAIEERAKKEATVQNMVNGTVINVLGHPMKIETNMQNRAVEITLPLPTDVTQEQLNHLAIFIEHSDGTKEIVRGQVVTLADGKLGVQFTVQKFSTFAVLYLPKEEVVEEVVEEAPVEEVPTPQVSTQLSYIQGYADGTFRPNAHITRAQMAAMLARNLSENDVPVSSNVSYSDTTASWAKEEIEYVRAQGIMNGRADDMFYPNGAITRAQMAAIAIRWIDKQCAEDGTATYCTADTKKITFNDVNNQHWAASYIGEISSLGIMTGVNASTFNPNGYLTRAQAVKVLNRLFERDIKMESFEESFSDVTSDHWAFFEIQAAVTE